MNAEPPNAPSLFAYRCSFLQRAGGAPETPKYPLRASGVCRLRSRPGLLPDG